MLPGEEERWMANFLEYNPEEIEGSREGGGGRVLVLAVRSI